MYFESRASQCIDTFIPNSETSVKLIMGQNIHGILEDRKSSFLAKNSQSLNFNSELNMNNQILTYVEKDISETIQKRLQKENEQMLNEFSKTYIFIQDQKINLKAPVADSLRKNVKHLIEYSGQRYIGETNDKNEKQGKGILIYSDGSYYFGDFQNNLKNGLGVLVQKNQERYEGEFVKDEKTGKGKLYYINGDQYIGYLVDGLKQGQGKMIYYDLCATFIGQFNSDKREGQGIVINFNGNVIQDGVFKEDQYFSNKSMGTFKSLRSQGSKPLMSSRITNDLLEQKLQSKNGESERKVEINQIEIISNHNSLKEQQVSPNQQSFRITMEKNEASNNNCCCSLLPKSLQNIFRFS